MQGFLLRKITISDGTRKVFSGIKATFFQENYKPFTVKLRGV